ncbi:STAS domain-containing protein [Mycobacterium sp. 1274761.0]|uniref:STAS domain-containing protein n=1 Tax=Mycobacterium sp. 1274761.0 TaxID=1834077 RepID=UPI000800F5B5|nr:STAS domain-containing protein [Mycobacterium sp. 1274761.0]OBK71221.1 hypothetical protein A5651_19560 [Mycobacterium sp. 1274761.0]
MTVIDNVRGQAQFTAYIDRRSAAIAVESRGASTIVAVTGDVDASNADFVTTVLQDFVAGSDRIVVDVSGLEFVGIQGLRVLIDFDARCRTSGRAWVLVPCGMLRRLIDVVDMGRHLPASESVDDALDHLNRDGATPHDPPRVAADKLRC